MKLETSKKLEPTVQSLLHTTHKAVIDASAANLVMDMLSKLYNNPLKAAIREYVSNGVDAHVKDGVTRPVEVTLPTFAEPKLVIRDFGHGMSVFDIITIYGNFGTSDKRQSDDYIGGFGIGSKSGLAVSDIIDVTSIANGEKNVFCVKRTSDGIVTQFREEAQPAKGLESGTTIQIDVNPALCPITAKDAIEKYWSVLAGWPQSKVVARCHNQEIADTINDSRIPDTWHEWKNGYTTANMPKDLSDTSGFLVGDVLYAMPRKTFMDEYSINALKQNVQNKRSESLDGFNTQQMAVKLDIEQTKVSYSREKVLYESNQETAAHVLDRLYALYDEVIRAAHSFRTDQTNVRTYVRRLAAIGIDVFNAKETYFEELSRATDANGNPVVLKCLGNASSIASPDGPILELHLGDGWSRLAKKTRKGLSANDYKGKLLITTQFKTRNVTESTMAGYVRKATNAAFQLHMSSPSLDTLKTYVENTQNGWQKNIAYIIPEEMLSSLAYSDTCTVIAVESLRDDAKVTSKPMPKLTVSQGSSNVTMTADPAYGMDTRNTLYPIAEKYQYNDWMKLASKKLLILDERSQFAFNTRNVIMSLKLIAYGLGYDSVLCKTTKRSQSVLQASLPDADCLSDDEIVARYMAKIEPFVWLPLAVTHNDVNEGSMRIVYSVPNNKFDVCFVRDSMGLNTRATPKVLPFTTHNISEIKKAVNHETANFSSLIPLQDMLNNAKTPFASPGKTYAWRLLSTLAHSNRCQLEKTEVETLVQNALDDYKDEIAALSALYAQYGKPCKN